MRALEGRLKRGPSLCARLSQWTLGLPLTPTLLTLCLAFGRPQDFCPSCCSAVIPDLCPSFSSGFPTGVLSSDHGCALRPHWDF